MAVYGTRKIQLGPLDLKRYHIGDTVSLKDGVHVSRDGVIVVIDSVFVLEFPFLYDDRGHVLLPNLVIKNRERLRPPPVEEVSPLVE